MPDLDRGGSSVLRVRSKGLFAAAFVLACLMIGNAAGAAQKRERSPATESLFLAITANDLGAVKTSLLAGADVEAENDSGRTPVDVAVDLGNFSIAHYLLAWRKNLASQRERKATIAAVPEPEPRPQAPSEPTPPAEIAGSKPVSVQTLAPAVPAFEPKADAPAGGGPAATPAPTEASSGPVAPLAEGGRIVPPSEVRKDSGTLGRIGGLIAGKPAGDQPPAPAAKPEAAAQSPATPASPSPAQPAAGTSAPGVLRAIVDFFTVAQTPAKAPVAAPATLSGDPARSAAARAEPPSPAAEAKPAEAQPATTGAGPDKKQSDTFLDAVFKVLADAQRQQEGAVPTRESAAPDRSQAKAAETAPPVKQPPSATVKAATPPDDKPAPQATAATNPESPGELLGRITDFIFVRPKSPPATPEPAAAVAAARPAPAKELPAGAKTARPAAGGTAGVAAAGGEMPRTALEPAIGNAMKLGRRMPADGGDGCIDKSEMKVRICVEPVDWPRGVADVFAAESGIYRGRQAIVRYDDGAATQFHVLFPTGNFEAVEEYFVKRLGPPGARPDLWVPMIGSANRKNRALLWLGPKPEGGGHGTTLEIREFDDLRWSSPPDMTHGVVRLYGAIDEPVFKHASWSDFLLVKMRRDPH